MIEIRGRYNTALCYTSALEKKAAEQIRTVCDQEEFAGCRIRIMPDVHAGKGCTIGTTMTISDKVVPGMVGVDIGCGMETVRLAEREIDFAALDALIRREVPSGRNVRGGEHPFNAEIDLSELRCAHSVSLDWARRSIGTLGGGNHFIEIDRAENGALYLVVHSGSRYLGTQVCAYYQEQGQLALRRGAQERVNALIAEYRAAGRQREIRSALKELDGERVKRIPKDLAYVEGELFEDYIHDMHITQRFAALDHRCDSARHGPDEGRGIHDRPQLHRYGKDDPPQGGCFRRGRRKAPDPDQYARRQSDLHRKRQRGVELLGAPWSRTHHEPHAGRRAAFHGRIPHGV